MRLVLGSLLVVTVLVSGISSTLMTVDYWTLHSANNPNEVAPSEIVAMDYIRNNSINPIGPADLANFEKVATYTDVSHRVLQTFAGVGTYAPNAFKGLILFDATRPEEPLCLLSTYSTDFLYLAQRDQTSLKNVKSFMTNDMFLFNNCFKGPRETVYSVPQMSPPQPASATSLILPSFSTTDNSYYPAMMMLAESQSNYTMTANSDSSLWNKQVLVLPSDVHTPIQTCNVNLASNWTSTSPNLVSSMEDNTLVLSGNNDSNKTVFYDYQTSLPTKVNAVTSRYLEWQVDVKDMVADNKNLVDYAVIKLYDDDAKDWFTAGAISLTNPDFTKIQKNSWTDITFDLQNNLWKHQFGTVSKISIELRISANSTQSIKTNSLSFYDNDNSDYNPTSTSNILSWVNNGGQLIVTNTNTLGDFAKVLGLTPANQVIRAQEVTSSTGTVSLPTIKVDSTAINDAGTTVIVNYSGPDGQTPFAVSKKVGNGEIIYLLINSYTAAMQNSGNTEKCQLINTLGSLLNLTAINLPTSQAQTINKYPVSFHDSTLQGAVELNSSFVQLPDKLSLSSFSTNQLGGSSPQTIQTNDAMLKSIQVVGDVEWTIDARSYNLTSKGYGLYSPGMLSGGFQVTILLSPGANVTLNLEDKTSGKLTIYKISDTKSVTLTLYASDPSELISRTPHISVDGAANFNQFYLDKVFYSYAGQNVILTGKTSFDIGFSDVFSMVSNLKTTYKIQALTSSTTWNEWSDVPWKQVLLSPLHWLLIAVLIFVLIVSLVKQRKYDKVVSVLP